MQAGADGNCPKIWRIQPYLEVSEALEVLDIAVERSLSFHCATHGLHLGRYQSNAWVAFSGFIAASGGHSVNNTYYKLINRSRSNVSSARIADPNVEFITREPRSDAIAFIQGIVVG